MLCGRAKCESEQRTLIYVYKPNLLINYFILYIYIIYNITNEYKEMDTFRDK